MFTRTALPPTYAWRELPRETAPMNAQILQYNNEQILMPTQRPYNAPANDHTGNWGLFGYADYQPTPIRFGRMGIGPALRLPGAVPTAPPRRRGR
jgi:hypothetical protein